MYAQCRSHMTKLAQEGGQQQGSRGLLQEEQPHEIRLLLGNTAAEEEGTVRVQEPREHLEN